MNLRYYIGNEGKRTYTLKEISPDGIPTMSAHPAKFSPEDKFSKARVAMKKRYNLLPTQQVQP